MASARAPWMSWAGGHRHLIGSARAEEIRRFADVGRRRVPRVGRAAGGLDLFPQAALAGEAAVEPLVGGGIEGGAEERGDLGRGRPDVAQEDLAAILGLADRLGREIDVDPAGEREGDHERRAHEEVRLHALVNTRLEVPVARQHRSGDKVALGDRLLELEIERPGVADAGRAAVADQVEAERVEVFLEAGLLQILGDDARAGGQRGLDPRVDVEAVLDGFFRQEARGQHHARVRGVGARRDRGDDDVAVSDVDLGAVFHGDGQDLEALLVGLAVTVRRFLDEELAEGLAELGEIDPILRPLGAGHGGLDRREIELEERRVLTLAALGHAEHPLRLVIAAEGVHVGGAAAGRREVTAGHLVDREVAHGRAVLGRHVGDRGALGDRERRRALAVELDELPDDLGLAQHLGDVEDEVGRGDALGERAGDVHADDVGHEKVDRLAEHAGLGLDPADAPADDAEAVDHRGVRIGPDERVGVDHAVLLDDPLGQELEVDLVADAEPGRHDAERVERRHPPLQELVALVVARELHPDVGEKRGRISGDVHLDRVIDDEDRRGPAAR